MSKKEYGGIRIIVHSEYISERSNPLRKRFFFSYRITIQNKGELPAKLLSRYWNITDAKGNVEEVRGPGVIGQQPRLEKGESFDYRWSSSVVYSKDPASDIPGVRFTVLLQ